MLRRTGLTVLAATVLVDMVGFGIVLPLLPFYAEDFGASPFEVTLIIASFSAMQLIAAPIWGRFSDRLGRRWLLIGGLFASAVSYLLFAVAHSLALLLLSRIAAGAAGGNISVAQAYVADSTEGDERAHGMGLIGAASGLGIMIGPAIGGFFSQWGLGAPGYVAALLCALNAVAAIVLLPESRHFRERDRSAAPSGEAATFVGWLKALGRFPLRVLLSVYFLTISSFTAMTAVLALYLERVFAVGASEMGLVFTAAGAVTVVVRGVLVGRIVKRIGEAATVRIGSVVLAVGLAAIVILPNKWWLAAVIPLWALGTGILFPSLASLVSRATDSDSQGSILGGSQLAGGLGRVLGPVWAGILFQTVSIGSPFLLGAVLSVLAFAMALRIPGPADRRIDPEEAWAGRMAATEPVDKPEEAAEVSPAT
ncbi:MAG: MFS transporter [Gemmatimonadota bacterium]|nr:MFS transporter [Gemmatimonadota bacterium]